MATERYISEKAKVLKEGDIRQKGTVVYKSTIPTVVRPADDDLIITIDEGDRLDYLAAKFYGSPSLWIVLASVNNMTNGSMYVPPGTQLRIPSKARGVG
jgi:nucleoid-associated protein YgaU